jgi:hypothetical protein
MLQYSVWGLGMGISAGKSLRSGFLLPIAQVGVKWAIRAHRLLRCAGGPRA